ncbi:MAG: ATP-binding protein [Pseudonocardiaceae bacterium]
MTGGLGLAGGPHSPQARRGSLGERLDHARRRRFFGRGRELELFETAMTAPVPPFAVLHVHGPGGVGKTALLRRFADLASAAGVRVVTVDAHEAQPSRAGLTEAFRSALGLAEGALPTEDLFAEERAVLLVDTYETALAIDDWLREELLPALPAGVAVVLAGRDPPTEGWRVDSGWNELLRVITLRNLPPDDARALLHAAGVPEALHDDALGFSHGHPLALSLLVDIIDQSGGSLDATALVPGPDVVRVLVERFTQGVASPAQRRALEASALLRVVTESLLRDALAIDDASDVFAWLRGLSFVEEGARGLLLHDLARDVLDAELRWRDPPRYAELHHRLQWNLVDQIQATSGAAQQRVLLDTLFLHRTSPALRGAYDWNAVDRVRLDALRPDDPEAIVAMTRRHEGAASARWVQFWLDRQPAAFQAFRGDGGLLGFCCYLRLHNAAATHRDADPGTRAVWEFTQRYGPPRPGEHVTFMRFMMDTEVHQRRSPAFNLRAAVTGCNWFLNRSLAWDVLAVHDPYPLGDEFAYLDYDRASEADFTVGEHRYLCYAHDWRRRPLAEWARLMVDRGMIREILRPQQPPMPVLSQPEFFAAVRAALRDLGHPARLAGNPLIRSRLIRSRLGSVGSAPESPTTLAEVVRAAVQALQDDPRDGKLFRALDRTYLRPASTQERAAQVLGLPFSTYRRHLTQGLHRVAARLWNEEVYGENRRRPPGEQ